MPFESYSDYLRHLGPEIDPDNDDTPDYLGDLADVEYQQLKEQIYEKER